MDLATLVRERRQALNITQEELADALGVRRTYLLAIEKGRNKLPNIEVRRQLAAILGIRHLDLLVAAGLLNPDEVEEERRVSPVALELEPALEGLSPEGLRVVAYLARELQSISNGIGGGVNQIP